MKVAGSYYNEIDPYAAAWLRNLVAAGHIAPGDVDTRSILDVRPDDLAGYSQCHFFAGIGGWSLAARLAGWPDDRPLWTGSCPCQPFSVAGKGEGQEDERHLWPVFFDLIRACRPDVVMGEQVAAAVGKHWLDGVHSDLESIGYSCGATVVPACAVDAPHRRDRLWFVADRDGSGYGSEKRHSSLPPEDGAKLGVLERDSIDIDVADATHISLDGSGGARPGWRDEHSDGGRDVDNAIRPRLEGYAGNGANRSRWALATGPASEASGSVFAIGADGKARRVGADFRRMVDGFSSGVGRLRSDVHAETKREIERHGEATATGPGEVLRSLWARVLAQPEADWPMGEQAGVCCAEILLAYLRQFDRSSGQSHLPFSGSEEFGASVRGLRQRAGHARASRGRGRFEQRTVEHPDALQALSWVLAQHAEKAWSSYRQENAAPLELLKHGVPARVGKLRAYGNAIVPQVAAEIIGAFMDLRP